MVASIRSMTSRTQNTPWKKTCKHTSYMQGALCNKLLTIYATAKTGWEVNPSSLCAWLSVSLSISISVSLRVRSSPTFPLLAFFLISLFMHKAQAGHRNIRMCSQSTNKVSHNQGISVFPSRNLSLCDHQLHLNVCNTYRKKGQLQQVSQQHMNHSNQDEFATGCWRWCNVQCSSCPSIETIIYNEGERRCLLPHSCCA